MGSINAGGGRGFSTAVTARSRWIRYFGKSCWNNNYWHPYKDIRLRMKGMEMLSCSQLQKSIPAEVQAAGPDDEPVVNSSIFRGFLVLPPNQMSSYASDPVTSFAV
ncbi:hypothetical protein L3X38_028798 [Prunus dulcis]|uniref:Uncharacterized protein n=1 Tax=Prunus dulcis TaxID=3755 RepID=A0AAD4VST8_PRUDU|nr:hypothetical protein L3X38_028798 [Prunus dulcis]